MQKKSIIVLSAFLFFSAHLFAGRYGACSHAGGTPAARTTQADPGEDDYDVKYLRFNIHVTDTSTYISGDVTTMAQVKASLMTYYTFELDPLLIIDSAKINGLSLPVGTTGFVRKIYLPIAISGTNYFTAQIFYHGTPPGGSGFFNGITHAVNSYGTHMVYTVSDPWVAKSWWPAKQSATDKIDSVDMFVTVPPGVVDGSNGVLVNVDSTSVPGSWTYHWHTHYPIDYYLVSIAVARYAQYQSYMHFTGSTDSMLIHNFFTDTAAFNPPFKKNFDSLPQIINFYSSLFGRYPFWSEKYGVCYTTLPGGMENQTMTTIGVPNTYIIAHELMHQWFGDHVTYNTWGDVWLSEGFATFSEQLFLTHFWSAAAGRTHRLSLLGNIFNEPCGMVYVHDTTTSDSLFDQATVYAKGQAVITMLRYIAPSDSAFFQVLRTYQDIYAFKNASTADFKAVAESVYGFSLDTFFNQWIYGRGFPVYKVSWNQVGANVFVKLVQTTSCPSYTRHFNTPLELQLHSTAGDTVIKVYNSLDTQVYVFNWSPAMANVLLNPDALTICKQNGQVVHDATLHASNIVPQNIKVLPNPSRNYWQIDDLPGDTGLVLMDMSGRTIWQGASTPNTTIIPGAQLPAGEYLLKLSGSGISENVKLVHW